MDGLALPGQIMGVVELLAQVKAGDRRAVLALDANGYRLGPLAEALAAGLDPGAPGRAGVQGAG
ncbi:hypothetical protein ACFW2T_27375 [Streptomyces sp. NPDC058892]|uniref:hypothetical protein n=1 Tax=unclassified Streptomyces TaxID=2593676 RepID=UPI0036A76C68